MKKILNAVLLLLFFAWPLSAQNRPNVEAAPELSGTLKLPHATEAIWDVKFDYNLLTLTGGAGNAGAVFIPSLNKFWVSRWSAPAGRIYVVSTAGAVEDSFTTPGFTGTRNMVFNGTHVVCATSSATLYKVDPATRAAAGTIALPSGVTARFVSYNPDGDGGNGSYWVGNWIAGALNYFEVSQTGAQLSVIANTAITGTYGIAFDKWSTGGPYLWVWSQGAGAGTPQNIIQLSIATGQPTGVQHDVVTDVGLGQTGAIAGGMFISDQLISGIVVLGGVMQGAPDKLFGYEIATLGPPPGPGFPTNPSPANNATAVDIATHPYISWTNPATGVVYNKVYFSTNLNEVNTFSPNALVLNGSPSTVHTSYNNAANLQYNTDYFWRVIEQGTPDSTTGPVWRFKTALAPAPNPPTSVTAVWTPQPNQTTVNWVNPTTNIFGQTITVDSSIIYRSGTRVGKVTGTGTTFVEANPAPGLHVYTVNCYAAGFGSAPGASSVVGVGLYVRTFSLSGLNLAIPDNTPAGVESELFVMGLTEANVVKVVVTVDTIIHTWDSDLDISLVTPTGSVIDLSSDNGSSGDNYISCVLDDDATASVTTAVAPMTGMWKPESPLGVLANTSSWGSWKLRVVDDAASDLGTLQAWSIRFITTEPIIPVELTSFTAVGSNGDVTLNWSTATEVNNKGFEVERKANGEFIKIAYIAGNGTTSEKHNYSFVDQGVGAGNYSYRLKQIDLDGTVSYSRTVEVDNNLPSVFELGQNYPNPFNPSTSVRVSLPVASKVTLKVFNTLGEEISTLVNATLDAGVHNVNFNAAGLNSGIYLYKIEANGIDGQSFTSIKKMILTK